jgi:hypothetical protein
LGLVLLALAGGIVAPQARAANSGPGGSGAPLTVRVGIYVVNLGNYDAGHGTFTLDFYIWFRFNASQAPANYTPATFELMNGRASSNSQISDQTDATTKVREVWYRVQANLYSPPSLEDYPFGGQTLGMQFEDSVWNSSVLVYAPLVNESGLDPAVGVQGFQISGFRFDQAAHHYKWGENYSQGRIGIQLSRASAATALKIFLPPLAFMIVSFLGFFMHKSKVANRVGLGTSMLISAVAFHISQVVSLPPLGSLILFDKIMFSVYAFLVCSLIIAVIISINEDFWNDTKDAGRINFWGGVATIVAPIVTFLIVNRI